MDTSENLLKQSVLTVSGRITLKNCRRDYFHLLKSPDFRLYVLRCAGSYSQVFTVLNHIHQLRKFNWIFIYIPFIL